MLGISVTSITVVLHRGANRLTKHGAVAGLARQPARLIVVAGGGPLLELLAGLDGAEVVLVVDGVVQMYELARLALQTQPCSVIYHFLN